MKFYFLSLLLVFTVNLQGQASDSLRFPQERHLKHVRQLTFGGENAEAYWSFNNDQLVFQRTDKENGIPCDRIFVWALTPNNMESNPAVQVSSGQGRTTCAYFLKGDSMVIYASTHATSADCPPEPERNSEAYYWPIYPSFDLYLKNLKTGELQRLTNRLGYDAEATVSPKGDKIVFTSDRSGDLELWTMDLDGSHLRQITKGLGYDGGAFFRPTGNTLFSEPADQKLLRKLKSTPDCLRQDWWRPARWKFIPAGRMERNCVKSPNLAKQIGHPFFTLPEQKSFLVQTTPPNAGISSTSTW